MSRTPESLLEIITTQDILNFEAGFIWGSEIHIKRRNYGILLKRLYEDGEDEDEESSRFTEEPNEG